MTLVSVFLATRNRPTWLPRAVASVRHQTDWRWELVVLDNSDEPYYQHNPWFDHRIVYRHEKCDGVADAYTKALRLTTGDVVVPLGDDDVLTVDCIATVYETFKDHRVKWANAKTQILDERGNTIAFRGGDRESVELTRGGEYWLGGAVWWRRELTEELGYDTRFDGAADFDLYLRFLEQSEPALIDKVMYQYTDWPGTDSRQRLGVQRHHSAVIAREWNLRRAA